MKKIGLIILVVSIINITAGCQSTSPKITEKEAEAIAIKSHSNDITIKSISHERGLYKVNWEIDADCEFGAYYIDDQSGKIIEGEETIC